jgi:hypothetical protein
MNIRNEIYKAIKEGLPITLPNQAQQERNGETYVLVTDLAPDNVKELAGDSRQAFIVSEEPLKISFPNSESVVDVSPEAIVKESVDSESVVQTKTVSGRKVQIKKVGSGPAHKVYVEDDPAHEFPSAEAAKSWLTDYEAAGGHFTYESKQVRNYVKNWLGYIGGTNLNEGSMDKMDITKLWGQHELAVAAEDQGWGKGYLNPALNSKKAKVIHKFVAEKFGEDVAKDMDKHSSLSIYEGEYASGSESKKIVSIMKSLRKKHNVKISF